MEKSVSFTEKTVSIPDNGHADVANGSSVKLLWSRMVREATHDAKTDSMLEKHLQSLILSRSSFEDALSHLLAVKLAQGELNRTMLHSVFFDILKKFPEVIEAVEADIEAVNERDPACPTVIHCFLNFKGFQACQAYRICHQLWKQGRRQLACVIQSRMSEVFAVDIHPAARIGKGVLFDHATGVVIGETAVVGNNVAILHGVTLGGTGKEGGDRHPKVGDGVLIGAGACIIGNIKIGNGAKIGAGAVVLMEVPPKTTAVGCPARLIGGKSNPTLLKSVPSETMDHLGDVLDWSDFVI